MIERLVSHWNSYWDSSGRRRMASSAAVSFVLHVTVVATFAFWLLPLPAQPRAAIETIWSEAASPETFEPVPLSIVHDEDNAGGASEGAALFQHQRSDEQAARVVDLDDMSAVPWHTGPIPDPLQLAETVSTSGGLGGGIRGHRGGGDGLGDAFGSGEGGSRFFGTAVEGKRVVYVVDASRSMNHPHPGPMLTRFGRVKLELIRAISQMTPDQEFFIMYFNDRALPMPSSTAVRATRSAQEKYLRWAAEFRADGFTNPEQALALALNLRPDVVYFLTDGRFPAKIVDEVTRANRTGVKIHTIGFADDEGEDLLRAIADHNWGEYRFIPETEDDTSERTGAIPNSQARPTIR